MPNSPAGKAFKKLAMNVIEPNSAFIIDENEGSFWKRLSSWKKK